MASVRLEPMSLGEILNTAIRIYRARFGVLVRLVALFVVPVEIVAGAVRALSSTSVTTTSNGAVHYASTSIGSDIGNLFASVVLVFLANQLAAAASLKTVSDAYLGHPSSWRASLEFVTGKIGAIVTVALLAVLLELGAAILFILPGVYFGIAWVVAMPSVLIEDSRGMSALRRSRELVRGRWWPTLGIYLVAAIITGIASLIVSTLVLGIFGASRSSTGEQIVVQAIGAIIGAVLTTPFVSAVIALIYFDLRVRKEGLDLVSLAEGVRIDPLTLPRGMPERPGQRRDREDPPYPPSPWSP